MLAKRIALSFGITLFFPMLVYFGVRTWIPEPQWEDYQVPNYHERRLNASPEERITLDQERDRLQAERKSDEQRFGKHLFWVAVPVGLIAVVVGVTVAPATVGTGFIVGGIFSVLMGYMAYWEALPDGARFLSLLVAFLVLVVMGSRRWGRAAGS